MTTILPIVKISGLDVFRGEAQILRDISFEIPRNSVTALLGRNGAGKTTTLLALLGLLPSRGSISFDGQELQGMPVYERVKLGMAYVPEDREVFSELSVAENLRLATFVSSGSAARLQQVHELFPILRERANQRAGTLSGGQQQMIAIARALLNDNKVLLIDEPSKGLAPSVVTDVVVAIERVKSDATILLVEQNLAVAARLADHVVVLDQGRVVHTGTMTEFIADTEATNHWLGVDMKKPSSPSTKTTEGPAL